MNVFFQRVIYWLFTITLPLYSTLHDSAVAIGIISIASEGGREFLQNISSTIFFIFLILFLDIVPYTKHDTIQLRTQSLTYFSCCKDFIIMNDTMMVFKLWLW